MEVGKTKEGKSVNLSLKMGNRHGFIAGATGTGKTVTLQKLAELFLEAGVPVFAADVKGDLSGISQVGAPNPKIEARLKELGIDNFSYSASNTKIWDVFGEGGIPLRIPLHWVSPTILSQLLDLNDTQGGVLQIILKAARDNNSKPVTLDHLRQLLIWGSENADDLSKKYGNVAKQSVASVQRKLLELVEGGGDKLFDEATFSVEELLKNPGQLHLLDARKLLLRPASYCGLLFWLMTALFETLPEVGDLEKPKLVFFFDEAHLLFGDAPKPLIERIEQVVRLIRSKGVGIYFITQHPNDVPDIILAQLGNRFQHALRAFTPKDQKAVKTVAESFVVNPSFDTLDVISQLGTGEALVSCLDEKGTPQIVERCLVTPPKSRIGAITDSERAAVIAKFNFVAPQTTSTNTSNISTQNEAPIWTQEATAKSTSNRQGFGETIAKSFLRSAASSVGREITKYAKNILLGALTGKKK